MFTNSERRPHIPLLQPLESKSELLFFVYRRSLFCRKNHPPELSLAGDCTENKIVMTANSVSASGFEFSGDGWIDFAGTNKISDRLAVQGGTKMKIFAVNVGTAFDSNWALEVTASDLYGNAVPLKVGGSGALKANMDSSGEILLALSNNIYKITLTLSYNGIVHTAEVLTYQYWN